MAIYLKQSTASQEVPIGFMVDSTDGNTEKTALTIANTDIKLWKTGATTLANKNSGGATHISNGVYYAVLDATDTDTLGSLVLFVHVASALAVRLECVVLAANIYDSLIGGGDILDVSVTQWLGTAAATPTVAGVPEVDVTHIGGGAQSATDLKDFADDGYDPATNKVQGVVLVDSVTAIATGGITAGSIAADAIGASELAADAVAEIADAVWDEDATGHQTQGTFGQAIGDPGADTDTIWALTNTNLNATVSSRASQTSVDTIDDFLDTEIVAIKAVTDALPNAGALTTIQSDLDDIQTRLPAALTTGTSDSGTTTTMVDAARTEADTDYWKGCWIRFTSGTISGQVRLITGFTPASDTITFAPATTQAVSTQTYEILPAARIDIGLWLGSLPNDLISGRVDSNVQAMANGVITAAVVATDAIDADAIADNAINAAAIADNAITSAKIATDAIGAAQIAADAIGSSELAASAVTEIQSGLSTLTAAQVNAEVVDALATDTYAEPGQGAPAATATLAAKINYIYKFLRNKVTQTSTTYSIFDDAGTTVDQKSTVSDDGTTFTRGEITSGP